MDLTTISDAELEELQTGAADLLFEVSKEKVRRIPCCEECDERRMALSAALGREVIHE
jgi:hypothetical protein